MLSASREPPRNSVVLYSMWNWLKEGSSGDKEAHLSNVFQTYPLRSEQVMTRHHRGEKTISQLFHSPLKIPHVLVTLGKLKCCRDLVKDFINLLDFHKRFAKKIFCN